VVQAEPVADGEAGLSRRMTHWDFRSPSGNERGDGVPQAVAGCGRESPRGHGAEELGLKIIAPDLAQEVFAPGDLFLAYVQCGHHRGDGGDVFRAGAASHFLFAAEEQGGDVAAMRDLQDPTPRGPPNLWAAPLT